MTLACLTILEKLLIMMIKIRKGLLAEWIEFDKRG